ncbi:MAG: TSUP family transporter, partial [Thermoanaerobacteraceae bacterium]
AAIIALFYYIKNKKIIYKFTFYIVISGILGSIIGSYLSIYMNAINLKKLFSIFLIIIGIYEIISKKHV